MAFNRVPTQFMFNVSLLSYDAFTAISRRSQCVHYSSRRPHCVNGVLKKQCRDFPNFSEVLAWGLLNFENKHSCHQNYGKFILSK